MDTRAGILPSERSKLGFAPLGAPPPSGSPAFQAFGGRPLNIFKGQQEATEFALLQGGLAPQQAATQASVEARQLANLIGFLPAPFKIPASFFQSLLPAEKNALISAYRFAGVKEADFTHLLTAPQLSFNPQRATAVG